MTSMATQSTHPLPFNVSPATPNPEPQDRFSTVLLAIYSVVLLCGTISLALMINLIRSNTRSLTSITVLNLIFAHFVFLFTLPFRIYYYATHRWTMGFGWCKIISSMIHIHMYMSFIFYVIILITRLLAFYYKAEQVAVCRRLHALLISCVVWVLVLVAVPFILYFFYGKHVEKVNTVGNGTNATVAHVCFKFGNSITDTAMVFNYVISTAIIAVTGALTVLQAHVLLLVYRRHGGGCMAQQEFLAQLKSLCFALIMVVCFIPYHIFRLHYIHHLELQDVNEVFLSLTTFSCLDMLTFLGRGAYCMCLRGKAT